RSRGDGHLFRALVAIRSARSCSSPGSGSTWVGVPPGEVVGDQTETAPAARNYVKDGNQVTEILEAFDLTGSFRAAGELAGCSPNTVASWVAKRDRGELGDLAEPVRRERLLDEYMG